MAQVPQLWPPVDLEPSGWLALAGPLTVSGPWVPQVRFALRVLDPLPAAEPSATQPRTRSAAASHGPASGPHIRTVLDPTLPPEGYHLTIAADGITLAAADPRGALQGCTTVRQLLPADAWRETAVRRDDWVLPQVGVRDAPGHEYRGFMLDVCRHFAPVHEVLRWIELASMHRLNHLHLHLTDDQGWRIESPSFPALTEVGAWRSGTWIGHATRTGRPPGHENEPTPHGGFYTRADLREITDHAARHGITLVPEVDLPGHACALLASIPELGVPGIPVQQVATTWGLLGRTISPLPEAMAIVATLLAEAAEAVDSPYLHIGGDEADLAMWAQSDRVRALAAPHGGVEGLRGVVNAQLAQLVLDLGRTPIAWDDAFVAGGLPTGTVVMPWRAESLGAVAAAAGHDVIMTPMMPTYLDHGEAIGPDEPLALAAAVTLDDVATWAPGSAPPDAPGRVLGGQGQLWTEYTPDQALREYRVFPRLSMLAANLWRGRPLGVPGAGGEPVRDALDAQLARLDARHVNHRPLTGPRPWQRAGTGRRAPIGVRPSESMSDYVMPDPS